MSCDASSIQSLQSKPKFALPDWLPQALQGPEFVAVESVEPGRNLITCEDSDLDSNSVTSLDKSFERRCESQLNGQHGNGDLTSLVAMVHKHENEISDLWRALEEKIQKGQQYREITTSSEMLIDIPSTGDSQLSKRGESQLSTQSSRRGESQLTLPQSPGRMFLPLSSINSGATIDVSVNNQVLDEVNEHWEHRLSNKIADALIYVWLGVYTASESVLVVIAALVTVLVQSIFTYLVVDNLMEGLFDDSEIISTLRDWRMTYAHNPDYADPYTSEPLAKSICQRSNFIMEGTQQADLYRDMYEYLGEDSIAPGAILCLLSMILWILTCTKRLMSVTTFTWASFCSYSLDYNSKIETNERNDRRISICAYTETNEATEKSDQILGISYQKSTLKLKEFHGNVQVHIHMSLPRAIGMLVFSGIPEIMLTLILGYSGTRFLISTIQLSELVLNAIALEVVLNFDEMVFRTLAPHACSELIEGTVPLKIPKPMSAAMIFSYARLALLAAVCFFMTILYLVPMVSNMKDAQHVMCSGAQNFLAIVASIGPVIVGVPTVRRIEEDYSYRAILQRSGLEHSGDDLFLEGDMFRFESSRELKTWRDRSIKDWAMISALDTSGHFSACLDTYFVLQQHLGEQASTWRGSDFETATWHAMKSMVSNNSIESCADVAYLCSNVVSGDAANAVRFWCPMTCRSNNLAFGHTFARPQHGVPNVCVQADQARALGHQACTQQSQKELPQNLALSTYVDGIFDGLFRVLWLASNRNLTHVESYYAKERAAIYARGCDYFAQPATFISVVTGRIYSVNYCDVEDPQMASLGMTTARPLCPIACGCNTTIRRSYIDNSKSWTSDTQCPKQCFLDPSSR